MKKIKILLVALLCFGALQSTKNDSKVLKALTTDGTKTFTELFPDPTLAINVVEQLNNYYPKPAVPYVLESLATQALLNRVGFLQIENHDYLNLNSLEGIEYLQNLNDLRLIVDDPNIKTKAPLSDLSPLSTLSKLEFLRVEQSLVTDLTPLSNITTIVQLSLNNGSATDLSPILNLPLLYSLEIAGYTGPLDFLSSIPKLAALSLNNRPMSNLDEISNLTGLAHLELSNTGLKDFSQLSTFSKLGVLNLENNGITDLTSIGNLTNVYAFHLANNNISDVSPMAKLTFPRYLNFDNNHISDISSLNHFTTPDNFPSPMFISATGQRVIGTPIAKMFTTTFKVPVNSLDGTQTILLSAIDGTMDGVNATYQNVENISDVKILFKSEGIYNDDIKVDFEGEYIQPLTGSIIPAATITTQTQTLAFVAGSTVTESSILESLGAANDQNATMSVDLSGVNFNVAGTYTVYINAKNATGTPSTPVALKIVISAKLVATGFNSSVIPMGTGLIMLSGLLSLTLKKRREV